jgi:hypothetical protein
MGSSMDDCAVPRKEHAREVSNRKRRVIDGKGDQRDTPPSMAERAEKWT